MQPSEELGFTLDVLKFDYLVLGTGTTEQLLSSSIQKVGKLSCLVLDMDDGYSSSVKSVHLKDIDQMQGYKQPKTGPQVAEPLQKKSPFEPVELDSNVKSSNEDFLGVQTENKQYRKYNIDLQPKLILSSSPATTMMSQADLDKYLEFRAVNQIYHFDHKQSKFIATPCTKGDIFKSKDLSLLEKKQMFNLLHTLVKLANIELDYETDQNSLNEFDQEYQVAEDKKQLYQKYKYMNCLEFLQQFTQNQKIIDIFLYTLCNYEYNPALELPLAIREDYLTANFLKRLSKFIRSCGVHTKLPYLYTNYGTGDIPQVFSRIASVYGSTYIINKQIRLHKIVKPEGSEYYQVFTNLAGKQEFIEVKRIIVGPEFKSFIESLTKNEAEKPQETEKVRLLRLNVIAEKERVFKKQPRPKKQPSQEQASSASGNPESLPQVTQDAKVESEEEPDNLLQKPRTDMSSEPEPDNKQVGPEVQTNKVEEEKSQSPDKGPDQVKQTPEAQQEKGAHSQDPEEDEFEVIEEPDENEAELNYNAPHLLIVPPNHPTLGNAHPIHILHLDSSTMACPNRLTLFQLKTVVPCNLAAKPAEMKDYIEGLTHKLLKFLADLDQLKAYPTHRKYIQQYVAAFLQVCEGFKSSAQDGITYLADNNFDLDLDRNFEEFKQLVGPLSNHQVIPEQGNFFKTLNELNGKDPQHDDSQLNAPETDDNIEHLLSKFNQISCEAGKDKEHTPGNPTAHSTPNQEEASNQGQPSDQGKPAEEKKNE